MSYRRGTAIRIRAGKGLPVGDHWEEARKELGERARGCTANRDGVWRRNKEFQMPSPTLQPRGNIPSLPAKKQGWHRESSMGMPFLPGKRHPDGIPRMSHDGKRVCVDGKEKAGMQKQLLGRRLGTRDGGGQDKGNGFNLAEGS